MTRASGISSGRGDGRGRDGVVYEVSEGGEKEGGSEEDFVALEL